MSVRVLVIDDHAVVRAGLEAVFASIAEIDLVAAVATRDQARACLERCDVDVAIIDVHLGGEDNGFAILQWMRNEHPDIVCVIFSMRSDGVAVQRAARLGARHYVSKADDVSLLIDAICGRVSPLEHGHASGEQAALSLREEQVEALLIAGSSPGEIAAALDVAPSTVSTHIRRIKDKRGVRTVVELVRRASDR